MQIRLPSGNQTAKGVGCHKQRQLWEGEEEGGEQGRHARGRRVMHLFRRRAGERWRDRGRESRREDGPRRVARRRDPFPSSFPFDTWMGWSSIFNGRGSAKLSSIVYLIRMKQLYISRSEGVEILETMERTLEGAAECGASTSIEYHPILAWQSQTRRGRGGGGRARFPWESSSPVAERCCPCPRARVYHLVSWTSWSIPGWKGALPVLREYPRPDSFCQGHNRLALRFFRSYIARRGKSHCQSFKMDVDKTFLHDTLNDIMWFDQLRLWVHNDSVSVCSMSYLWAAWRRSPCRCSWCRPPSRASAPRPSAPCTWAAPSRPAAPEGGAK